MPISPEIAFAVSSSEETMKSTSISRSRHASRYSTLVVRTMTRARESFRSDADQPGNRVRGLELGGDHEVDVDLALAPRLEVLDARGAHDDPRARELQIGCRSARKSRSRSRARRRP